MNPKILIVSDIHLGSLDCERDLFIQFLRSIINGEFGNDLQGLIILGDFIDLCTDTPAALLKREKVQEIFTLLLQIKSNLNLIFVLGNHEIPVIGDYDEKFERRKKKFLNKFKDSNFNELFKDDLYYQYILLTKWNNEDMLLMYNSRDKIENQPLKIVKVDGLDLDNDYKCLMTHGYQFDNNIYRFFVGQIWKSLISNNKFEVKETYDYFWNEVIKNARKIKPIRFEEMKEDLAKLKKKTIESMDSLFSDLNILEFNLIKANMRVLKKWERASKPDYYHNEIKRFLVNEEYNFSKINHVIYGHSHRKGITNITINDRKIEIINDGAWQHVQPSYVEIHCKGNIYLKSLEIF